jgi:hypothetical protein
MKAKIIRGTTLKGKAVNEGEIVELDASDFRWFVADRLAVEATPEEIKAAEASAKKGK